MRISAQGKALAAARMPELTQAAAALATALRRQPAVGIVAADEQASRRFVALKQHAFTPLGIAVREVWLGPGTDTTAAIEAVEAMNRDALIDAIFVQFPLPAALDGQRIADAIDPRKDIDCSSTAGLAAFESGASGFVPVAAAAATALLVHELNGLHGRNVAIVGECGVFEVGVDVLCQAAGAQVHINDGYEAADAIIVTDQLPAAHAVRGSPVLLDAGYYLPARRGDWLPAELAERVSVFMPQYGNVGPLTVAELAAATLRAAASSIEA